MQINLVVKNNGLVTQTLMHASRNSTTLQLVNYYPWYILAERRLCSIYATHHETLATPSITITLHHQNLESERRRGRAH